MAIDPATVQGSAPEGAATEGAPTGAPEGTAPLSDAEILSRIAGFDPERIFAAHPELKRRMDGTVGTLAQQQARRLTQQQVQQELAQREAALREQVREEERLRLRAEEVHRLRDAGDLVTYAEQQRVLEQEQQTMLQRRQQQSVAQQAQLMAGAGAAMNYDQQVLNYAFAQLPPEAQARLAGKQYADPSGDGYAARRAYLADVMAEHANARLQTERATWEKTQQAREAAMKEALRKELLGEMNGDTSVDTGSGTSVPTDGIPSQLDWAAMTRAQRADWFKRDPRIEERLMAHWQQQGGGTSFASMQHGGGG